MTANLLRLGRIGICAVASAFASTAWAQTPVKFSLDFKFEGPAAPFVVAIDKGYFRAEGLDVTIDTAGGSLEPINRVASGTYDMGFGDINSLIKFRDANPGTPIKAVSWCTTSRRSPSSGAEPRRGGAEGSRRQEARRPAAGRRVRAVADLRAGERHRGLQGLPSSASASRCASRCSPRARSTRLPDSRSPPTST